MACIRKTHDINVLDKQWENCLKDFIKKAAKLLRGRTPGQTVPCKTLLR
jgi:hypothetical protein